MQTYEKSLSDDHAGARWAVPFLTVMTAVVLLAFLMLVYAHL